MFDANVNPPLVWCQVISVCAYMPYSAFFVCSVIHTGGKGTGKLPVGIHLVRLFTPVKNTGVGTGATL